MKKRYLFALPVTLVLVGITVAANYGVKNPAEQPAAQPAEQPAEQPAALAPLEQALEHVKVSPPPGNAKAPARARVRLETSKGPVVVELNGAAAPMHVKSFLHLSKMGFYDKTTFHRFAELIGPGEGRIIQGGDPLTKVPTTRDLAGQGGPGYQVPREPNNLKHDAMVIAAARSEDVNSAGSQFYLTLDPTYFLDSTGGGYTVFGKVVGGKDVVLKLRQDDVLKKVVILPNQATSKTTSKATSKARTKR